MTADPIKKNPWPAAFAAAATVAAAVIAVAIIRTGQLNAARTALDSLYHKALYETCEYTEAMAVNLSKLSAASGSSRAVLLGDVIRQAQGAQANIAMLPLGSASTARAMKYINQAGDFASVLLARVSSGGDITQAEYADIARLSETAAALSVGLGGILEGHEADEIELDMPIADVTGDVFSDAAVEYPTLLYDGPFSDGAQGAEFRALEGLAEVTREEARTLLTEFIGAQNVESIRFETESSPGVPCYEFSLTANGRTMSAAVTKTGGKVLYMLSSGGPNDTLLTEAECFAVAESFLISRGFGGMETSYYSVYDGVMTINFAAMQSGVILYPDLIKLQVSMADGAVIGIEAGNYLRSHTQRVTELPALTEADVRALVSPRLDIENIRLCIIPYGLGEKYCYEVSASSADGTYLIYIDAMTGAEAEIMQVVSDSDSTLVM